MNYRHAFHAGNFADVFKHIVIARILVHLREKATPFRVIDTHAGAGLYDLAGAEASRTGEWRDGIGRLAGASLPAEMAALSAPYLAALRDCNHSEALRHYPGSPLVAGHLLRPQDQLVACELEPAAAAALMRHARRHAQIKVVRIDGWTALNAYVPVKERRGLVIVDPAYEAPEDFARLGGAIVAAQRKWPTGIYLLWYPIKDRGGPDRLARRLGEAAITRILRAELAVASTRPDGALGACGIIIINPPWKLVTELAVIAPALVDALGRDDGRHCAVDHLGGNTTHLET